MYHQVKYYVPVVPIIVAIMMSGCSDGSSVEETPQCSTNASCTEPTSPGPTDTTVGDDTQSPSLPESLYHSWVSGCESVGDGAGYRSAQWQFSSDQIVLTSFSYGSEDSSCTNDRAREIYTYEATYLGEVQATTLGEAIKVDMLALRYVSEDENGVVYDSDESGLPADIGNEYNIFLVSEGKLFGGLLSSGDATTPETRPTAIDEDFGLSRN